MSKKLHDPAVVQKWAEMHASGLSYSQIGAQFNMTRGAIAGALGRLRNPFKHRERKKAKKVEKVQKIEAVVEKSAPTRPKLPVLRGKDGKRLGMRPDQLDSELDGPSIIELEGRQCRYPVTYDAPFRFCGRPAVRVYCKEHEEICYDRT